MKSLKEYMTVAGLNQAELAKRIGVHQGQLNHWINGRSAPTVANLKLISKATGINLEKLAEDL
jgi:transcriptional regulator with XRE-family HTH domain